MFSKITGFFKRLGHNFLRRNLMRYFDWPLFVIVLAISLFGVVAIFSASSIEVTEAPDTIVEMVTTQPTTYSGLQLIWIGVGILVMFVLIMFDYNIYGKYAYAIYVFNLILLAFVLFGEKGRGGMAAFFSWGSDRGIQPSEFGKVAIIISLAKAFSVRTERIMTIRDVLPLVAFLALPMVLIMAQPDVGTALVYFAIFCVMVVVSGTNGKLIFGTLACVAIMIVPLWYFMNNSNSDSFRLTRILIWLDPESYPDEARQVINGQIALGSGGLFGKGIVSPGSFASLGYISDDHTDFIFAIVGEAFGMVGCFALVAAYMLMFARLIYHAIRIKDPFGSYLLIGVIAMLLAHVAENICMVIGITPVTGIPLPFVSYGGSNMLTNMAAIGLAENVIIRSRQAEGNRRISTYRVQRL